MKTKYNRGVLTVEACIAFTVFAMIMFSLLFIIRIVYTYGAVQHGITQVAKEMATYSYIYRNNVSTAQNERNNLALDVLDEFGYFVNKPADFENSNGNVYDEDINATIDSVSDPKKAMKVLTKVFEHGTSASTKSFIGGEFVRFAMVEYIDPVSPTEKLDKLRIIGGLEGFDFSASSFYSNETNPNDIDIVVCYSIKPIMPIPFSDQIMPRINLVNRICARGW